MKIELKNIKHSEFASHETFCYEAILYVEGKPFAQVSNDGQGGSDRLYQDDRWKSKFDGAKKYQRQPYSNVEEVRMQILEADQAWSKCHALLKIHCADKFRWTMGDGWIEGSIETACHELVSDHLIRKDLNKALKEPCYLDGNQIVSYNVSSKRPNIFEQLRRQLKKPELVFLNELPKDEAFKMFKEVA
tara:strand:+ start:1166 stop:1732 length:567 start_codon:yes stop_codon:yes gene_type:complete